MKLKGIITLDHYRKGKRIDHEVITNTITTAGKGVVSGLINNTGGESAFEWLAIGTSSTAATAADTTLAAELTAPNGLDRIKATASQQTTTTADDTARLVHTFTNDSSNSIGVTEVGIFNTSTENAAQALGRQTFAVKNLANSDTLKVTYDIVVS